MYPVGYSFRGIPEDLSPVVAHTPRPRRIILAEIVQAQIRAFNSGNQLYIWMIRINISVCCGEIYASISGIYQKGPAKRSEILSWSPGFSTVGNGSLIVKPMGLYIIMYQMPRRPANTIAMAPLRIHGHRDHTFAVWHQGKIFDYSGRHVVG